MEILKHALMVKNRWKEGFAKKYESYILFCEFDNAPVSKYDHVDSLVFTFPFLQRVMTRWS